MFEVKKLMKNRTKYIEKFNKLFIKFVKGNNLILGIFIIEKLDKMWEAIKFSCACLDEKDKAETIYHEVFGGVDKILKVSEKKILASYNFWATVLCENLKLTFKQIVLNI